MLCERNTCETKSVKGYGRAPITIEVALWCNSAGQIFVLVNLLKLSSPTFMSFGSLFSVSRVITTVFSRLWAFVDILGLRYKTLLRLWDLPNHNCKVQGEKSWSLLALLNTAAHWKVLRSLLEENSISSIRSEAEMRFRQCVFG